MKITASVLGTGALWCFAQAGAAAVDGGSLFQVGTPLTIGGVVVYLLVHFIPKREAAHREERRELLERLSEQSKSHRMERDAVIARMDAKDTESTKFQLEMSARHAESTQSGHEAAAKLASEIRSMKEELVGK